MLLKNHARNIINAGVVLIALDPDWLYIEQGSTLPEDKKEFRTVSLTILKLHRSKKMQAICIAYLNGKRA